METREIKFRGRCVMTGNFAYGFYYPSKGRSIIRTEKDGESMVLPKSVGQFTGLTDKNGKDIYDGDIIKQGNPPIWFAPRVVEFRDGSWMGGNIRIYIDQDKNAYKPTEPISQNSWEVIGNIHQNPELITTK